MKCGRIIGLLLFVMVIGATRAFSQGAVRLYNEALQLYLDDEGKQAEEKVRLALKIQKLYPDAWFLLGQIQRQSRDYKAALKYYKKALKQTPTNPDYRFHKALTYDEMGKLRKAIRLYLATTEVDPNYTLAWKRLGAIYFLAQDFPKAIDYYSRGLDTNPMDKDGLLQRGNAQAALGNFPEAISDYDQALQLDSGDPDIYFNRASALFSQGDAYGAVKDFSMVLDRRPEDRDAWLNRGISLLALELYPQALEDLDQALVLDSSHADTWWNRAYLLHELDSIPAARAAITKATQLAPQDAENWLLRGRIEFRQRQYAAAIAAYDQCLSLAPHYAEAYLNRGEAHRVLGDENAACRDWKKVLKYDSEPGVHAEKARKWMAIICE